MLTLNQSFQCHSSSSLLIWLDHHGNIWFKIATFALIPFSLSNTGSHILYENLFSHKFAIPMNKAVQLQ